MIFVKLDDGQLQAWAKTLAGKGLRSKMSDAVNAAARTARGEFVKAAQKDVGGAAGKVRGAISQIKRANEATLSASFTAKSVRINVASLASFNGVTYRGRTKGGISFRTHVLTGGPSANAVHPHGFVVRGSKGGKWVAYRPKGSSRLPIKGFNAEHPATALGQDGSAPRRVFTEAATKRVMAELERAAAAAFGGR